MSPRSITWRLLPVLAATLAWPRASAHAEGPAVPLNLQVDLTAKLLEYVEAPSPARAPGGTLRIGILVKRDSLESQHAGTELKVALGRIGKIAGASHTEAIIEWSTPAAMAEDIKRRQLFAVYLTPGLGGELASLARALDGASVITIAAVDSYVTSGAILGFELTSGRPRMVLNRGQAKRQGVVFRASVMKLMRFVEGP